MCETAQLTLDGKPCNPSSCAQEAHCDRLHSVKSTFQRYQGLQSRFFSCLKTSPNSRKSTPQLNTQNSRFGGMFWTTLEKAGELWMRVRMIPDHRSRFHWRPPVVAPTVTYAPVEVGDVEMENGSSMENGQISRVFKECGNI